MKTLIPLLLIYVLITQGTDTLKATWSNDQPVKALLDERCASQGCTYQIVDQKTFDAQPNPIVAKDPNKQAQTQQAILDAKDSNKTTDERLNALIKAVLP